MVTDFVIVYWIKKIYMLGMTNYINKIVTHTKNNDIKNNKY